MSKKAKKHAKKGARKVAKVKQGTKSCVVARRGRGFSLVCPGVEPIKVGIVVTERVRYASKKVARAAKANKSTAAAVVTSSGHAHAMPKGLDTSFNPEALPAHAVPALDKKIARMYERAARAGMRITE